MLLLYIYQLKEILSRGSKPPIPPYWAAPKPLNSRLRASMGMPGFLSFAYLPPIGTVFLLQCAQF